MNKYLTANAEFSKFSRNYMESKKDLPIRPSEMGVLNIITQTPGPHTSVMLAELLGVSKPMVTAHISILTEKGYVKRQQSLEDKRVFYILPTEKATELVASVTEEVNKQLDQFIETIGEEKFESLVKMIGDINKILEANSNKISEEEL